MLQGMLIYGYLNWIICTGHLESLSWCIQKKTLDTLKLKLLGSVYSFPLII